MLEQDIGILLAHFAKDDDKVRIRLHWSASFLYMSADVAHPVKLVWYPIVLQSLGIEVLLVDLSIHRDMGRMLA